MHRIIVGRLVTVIKVGTEQKHEISHSFPSGQLDENDDYDKKGGRRYDISNYYTI